MIRFPLVQLAAHHAVQGFTCGNRPGAPDIDEYLRTSALSEQTAGLSRVWVATDPSAATPAGDIVGYFTLSPLSVPVSPAVLGMLGLNAVPYRAAGGYLLGRLGVAAHVQGQHLGSALVAVAIKLAKQARYEAGGAFLAVDPKNDKLLAWYERLDYGFQRLDPANPTRRRLVVRL